jgi:hypothetical protein
VRFSAKENIDEIVLTQAIGSEGFLLFSPDEVKKAVEDAIKNKKDIFGRVDKNQFGPLAEYGEDPFTIKTIDDSWPKFLLDNKEKYSRFIL